MVEYLNKLLANFVVMEYKVHSIHTDIVGSLFLDVHTLLWEIYNFFWSSNRDSIKERVRILRSFTPSSLSELIDLSEINEISKVPSLVRSLETVFADLEMLEKCLTEWCDIAKDDLVTQNILIDFNTEIGKFRRKIESVLAKATLV